MTELVVTLAFFGVVENLIGFADLFEFLSRFFVVGVAVRVVLHGQLAVGLFNFVSARGLADAEQLVIIAFVGSHIAGSVWLVSSIGLVRHIRRLGIVARGFGGTGGDDHLRGAQEASFEQPAAAILLHDDVGGDRIGTRL